MGACRALKYCRDRKKRWRWAAVACVPQCRSWTSSPPRKRTTWSKSWTTGASAPSIMSPPPYRRPVRPYLRICIRPPPGRIFTGKSPDIYLYIYKYIYSIYIYILFCLLFHVIYTIAAAAAAATTPASLIIFLFYTARFGIIDTVPDVVAVSN